MPADRPRPIDRCVANNGRCFAKLCDASRIGGQRSEVTSRTDLLSFPQLGRSALVGSIDREVASRPVKVAFQNRVVRTLTALYTLNTLLEWVASVAFMVVVYNATESALVTSAMLICKQIVPGFLVPGLGAQLDRIDLRRAMAALWFVSALSLALVGALGYGLWVFPLAAVAGLSSALVRTALRAAVACAVPPGELRGANACLNLAMGIAVPVGPALAAFVIHGAGAGTALLWTAAAVLLLPAFAALLPVLSANAEVDHAQAHESAPAPARRPGVQLPMLALLLLGGVSVTASSMTEPVLLAFSSESLESGIGAYGAICTAWALGVLIGSVVFTRLLATPMIRVYVGATVLSGLAYLGLALAPTVEFAVAVAAIGGIGTGLDWVAIVTAVQERGDRGSEARVIARLEAFATAGPAVGVIVGGLLADLVSPRVAIASPGLLLLGALAVLALFVFARAPHQVGKSGHPLVSPSLPGGST